MAFIYDLDNEYGGVILSDAGSPGPALQVNSNTAGQPALAILSTASANPVDVSALNLPVRIRSTVSEGNAVAFGRTVASSPTVAPLVINHPSAASAPVMEFGHFASITSVVLTTVSNFDYAVRVKLGNQYRWIPLLKDAGLVGTATF